MKKSFEKREKGGNLIRKIYSEDFSLEEKEKAGKEILKNEPSIEDLIQVMSQVDSLREEAWEIFSKKPIESQDLFLVIDNIEPLREKACEKLLELNPSKENLKKVIENSSTLKEKAGKELLECSLNQNDLYELLYEVDSLQEKAWEKLKEKTIDSDILCSVVEQISSLREEAGELILEKRNPSKKELLSVVYYVGSLQEKAWQELKEDLKMVNNKELKWVIHYTEKEIKKEAGKELLNRGLSLADLYWLIKEYPSLREKAWEKLKDKNPDINDELKDILTQSGEYKKEIEESGNIKETIEKFPKDERGNPTYRINKFLSLSFENKKTIVYINGKKFTQCKYLLLSFPKEDIEKIKGESLDDIVDNLDNSMEDNNGGLVIDGKEEVLAEDEFWGHCSNLQAFFENQYNTRILYHNLSFNLLNKLAEAGDPLAKEKLEIEITERFNSGNKKVIDYILKQGFLKKVSFKENLKFPKKISGDLYLNNLTSAEGLDLSEVRIGGTLYLKKLQSVEGLKLPKKIGGSLDFDSLTSVERLDLSETKIGETLYLNRLTLAKEIKFPKKVGGDIDLRRLRSAKEIKFPKKVGGDLDLRNIQSTEGLDLSQTKVKGSIDFRSIQSVKELDLSQTKVKGSLDLGNLRSAEKLDLSGIEIEGNLDLRNIQSTEGLDLSQTKVKGSIDLRNIQSVKELDLSQTKVEGYIFLNKKLKNKDIEIPKSIKVAF